MNCGLRKLRRFVVKLIYRPSRFVGMDMDETVWAPTVFSKNRDRLLNQEIARRFFRRVVDSRGDR
jgi:hypothetical protein